MQSHGHSTLGLPPLPAPLPPPHVCCMRNSWIISFAAMCGVGAFVYTLAVGSARNFGRDDGRGRGGRAGMTSAMAPLPETIGELEEYIQNNPRSGRAYFELARRLDDADRPDDARPIWEETVRLRRNAVERRSDNPEFWFELGWALMKLGRTEQVLPAMTEAERLYSEISQEARNSVIWHRLGWARKLLGQEQEAQIAWSRAKDYALERTHPSDSDGMYNLACYWALVGHREEALAALETAAVTGWTDAARAMHDEDLESLRGEARFVEALRRMRDTPRKTEVGPG